ncbi:MAG: hypothetical protein MHM6MM_006109, partial [Cercozoa sp. M6MM]
TIAEEGEALADVSSVVARQLEKATLGQISPGRGTPDRLLVIEHTNLLRHLLELNHFCVLE